MLSKTNNIYLRKSTESWKIGRRIFFSLLALGLLICCTFQPASAAPNHAYANVLLQFRGGQVLKVEEIELRPQRDTKSSIQYTSSSHYNSLWRFLDDGTFIFTPSDGGGAAYGRWQWNERTQELSFSAQRRNSFGATGSNSFAMGGTITQSQTNGIIAHVTEESSMVNAAVVNGQSFGSNSYKYIEFWLQLS